MSFERRPQKRRSAGECPALPIVPTVRGYFTFLTFSHCLVFADLSTASVT